MRVCGFGMVYCYVCLFGLREGYFGSLDFRGYGIDFRVAFDVLMFLLCWVVRFPFWFMLVIGHLLGLILDLRSGLLAYIICLWGWF